MDLLLVVYGCYGDCVVCCIVCSGGGLCVIVREC